MIGRKAVISGGSSGIGLAIARKLAAGGGEVVIADLDTLKEDLPATYSIQCDVASAADVNTIFTKVLEKMGVPDILICSAGRGIHEKLIEGDPEKWRKVIETNLLGTLRMVRAFTPSMLEAGRGDVIFISSVAARQAYSYGGIYAATKAAVEIVAETLRQEVLPVLRVTVIAPGVTDTGFFKNTVSGYHTAEELGYGALAPEQIADAVLFALNQPAGVSVNYIQIRPTAQPF